MRGCPCCDDMAFDVEPVLRCPVCQGKEKTRSAQPKSLDPDDSFPDDLDDNSPY